MVKIISDSVEKSEFLYEVWLAYYEGALSCAVSLVITDLLEYVLCGSNRDRCVKDLNGLLYRFVGTKSMS